MKAATFMAVTSVLALLFGLALLLVPQSLMSMYGITLDVSGQFIARYLGSAFVGVAVITWLARTAASGPALRAVILGGFVLTATGFIVAIFDKISGSGNALVWSTVVIYGLLAAGFGSLSFVKPTS